jgi:hypothetical protein
MDLGIIGLEFGLFAFLGGLWGIAVVILTALIHIVFAIAVYRDATRLDRVRTLIIAGPAIWGIATLIGGVITAAIYWAMHHSRLNPDIPITPTETTETEET